MSVQKETICVLTKRQFFTLNQISTNVASSV